MARATEEAQMADKKNQARAGEAVKDEKTTGKTALVDALRSL